MSIVDSIARADKDIIDGIRQYRIWTHLAVADVFSKYKRSILGPLWVSGSMLASSIALALVFGSVFHQSLPVVLPYIMAGILVWNFAGLVFLEGVESYLSPSGIIKSTPFPFTLHLYRLILRNAIVFGHNFIIYFAVKVLFGRSFIVSIEVIPGVILLVLFSFFTSGLAGMAAARFRDLRFLLPYIGQMVFMLTPIFWRTDQVNDARRMIYEWNPFYYIIRCVRDPLQGLNVPGGDWGVAVATVVVVGLVWWLSFALVRRRIAFWV